MVTLPPVPVLVLVLVVWLCTGGIMCSKPVPSCLDRGAWCARCAVAASGPPPGVDRWMRAHRHACGAYGLYVPSMPVELPTIEGDGCARCTRLRSALALV